MKIEITKMCNNTIVQPIDNIVLFEHCFGTPLGSGHINSCDWETFEDRIKPLLIAHGVTNFEMITTTL